MLENYGIVTTAAAIIMPGIEPLHYDGIIRSTRIDTV